MQVKLKILTGSNAGKEVKIPGSKLKIGRHQDCHLRPKSDAISRRHCEVVVKEDKVYVRDLKSRNGTFVNEEPVEGSRVLKAGDHLRVARLEFEVIIKRSADSPKPAKTKDAKKKKKHAAESGGAFDDDLVGDWLTEGGDFHGPQPADAPETRQLRLDETDQITLQMPDADEKEKTREVPSPLAKGDKGKQKPGKLPKRSIVSGADTREAANEMLRKFFNRG